MADRTFKILGWELKRPGEKTRISVVPPKDEDGSGYVMQTTAGHLGHYVDIDGDKAKDNYALIMKYRGISMFPEVDTAIDEIVNEAISTSELESSVSLNMDAATKIPDSIKKKMTEEFDNIVSMLDFNDDGPDMFRRWYVDGRLAHHILIDENNKKGGIKEIRFIDGAKIRKIKEVKYKEDKVTKAKIVTGTNEYFIYQEKPGMTIGGIKMTEDSVSYVTSGLLDDTRKKVISYLHKALKPVNQLRMMEDSLVIYRLSRAPERRIFYVDTGNLPKGKSDEYMKSIMSKYRNKLVYDSSTGAIKDERKHMTMLEDFWLPRREGGKGTEISTLPGGQNLGDIEDVIYFQKRLYRSLNVPMGRLEQEQKFSMGRDNEIDRDEVKFQKFIDRIRKKFSKLFLELLKKQLMLKNVITEADWEGWKNNLVVDYIKDNNFSELKENQLLQERLAILDNAANYAGQFVSENWIMKNVLRLNEEEIKVMRAEMDKEAKEKAEKEAAAAEANGGAIGDEDEDKFHLSVKKAPKEDPNEDVEVTPDQEALLVEKVIEYLDKD